MLFDIYNKKIFNNTKKNFEKYDEMLKVYADKKNPEYIILRSVDLKHDFSIHTKDVTNILEDIDDVFTNREVYISKIINISTILEESDDIESAIHIAADDDIVEEIEQCIAKWLVDYINRIQRNISLKAEVNTSKPNFIKLLVKDVGDSIELPADKMISELPLIQDVIESYDIFNDSLNDLFYNNENIKPLG